MQAYHSATEEFSKVDLQTKCYASLGVCNA
jgi:hypothetical protein